MTVSSQAGQPGFARALLDPSCPAPPGLRTWNGSSVERRFSVHRNNVVSSLIDVLASTFPVVAELLGEPFFRAMSAQFVRRHPPVGPVLALYGSEFAAFIADFIARHEAAATLCYLADVARLEFARVQACHSADTVAVDRQVIDFALSSADQVANLTIGLHPSVAVVESPFAIVSIWAAHQGDANLQGVDPMQAQTAIVLRMGIDVLVLLCTAAAGEFTRSLQRGTSLGQSAAIATDLDNAFDLAEVLGLLFNHAAITSICLPPGCQP